MPVGQPKLALTDDKRIQWVRAQGRARQKKRYYNLTNSNQKAQQTKSRERQREKRGKVERQEHALPALHKCPKLTTSIDNVDTAQNDDSCPMNNPFDDAVLLAMANGSGVESLTERVLTPTTPLPNKRFLSLVTFPSPNTSPTTTCHSPASPSSVLLDDLSKPHSLLNPLSSAGPVDPYDASLWRPESSISVPIRARDGEFERFIRDENGRLGHQDPTSCPALLMRLTHDVNHAKSCCVAWERAEVIDIRARYSHQPLLDFIDFRNNIAILQSNSNYLRRDIIGTLSGLTYLNAHLPKSDIEIIRQSNDVVAAISESILAMENLVTHLDAIIARSHDEYQRTSQQSNLPLDEDSAPVVLLDSEGEEVSREVEGVKMGQVEDIVGEGSSVVGRAGCGKRTTLPAHALDDDVIDISDDE